MTSKKDWYCDPRTYYSDDGCKRMQYDASIRLWVVVDIDSCGVQVGEPTYYDFFGDWAILFGAVSRNEDDAALLAGGVK